MLKKFCSVLSVLVLLTVTCPGQQTEVVFLEPQGIQQPQVEFKPMSVGRVERTSINVGAFMGGGGIIGGDLEFLIGKRLGLQLGAGFPSFGLGFRNVLKTTYNIILYVCDGLNLFHMKKGETFHIDPKPLALSF